MESVKNVCHDCGKKIEIEGEEILNGVGLLYKKDGEDLAVYKCKECYAKNPSLSNFQKCEVYSRVVGYLRPISQWNEGKQEEQKDRTTFQIKGNCCR